MAHETIECTLLLGVDYLDFGEYAVADQADGRSACAISVGMDARTRSSAFKGDHEVPNEDAVLVIDEGSRTLLAVADAHYGHEASHVLLERLADIERVPHNVLELVDALRTIASVEKNTSHESEAPGSPSETTLLVAVVDREAQRCFGVCYGDSTLVVAGDPRHPPIPRHSRPQIYVTPEDPVTLHPARAVEFDLAVPQGALVVVFTDGVDECCYRDPARSIQAPDLEAIAREHATALDFVASVTEAALCGVRGNPGGEDNIAVAATRV